MIKRDSDDKNMILTSFLRTIIVAILGFSIYCSLISISMQQSYEQPSALKSALPSPSIDNRIISNTTASQTLNITITPGATSPMSQTAGSDYDPKIDQVNVSNTITWTNKDSVVHTVTYKSGNLTKHFDSGNINPDKVFSQTFTEKGTANYYCKLHTYMKGVIHIK
jgi:plastocyanin